ncbi:hypothetical protein [Mycobacterium sp. 1274756.6]|uniref:hypothetical protein n=1 Tax=Mycobacterium sp. 1274756.6 TaxID=1834076 RepID=UPI000801BE88|nr:hypothetical protein [Mycobacterium sp. 1274756.6]OBJ67818.1 hypothetical protein A5643_15025 [Mycobacterium sp. 1274756.6]
MSFTRSLLTATAVVAGSSAALLMGGIAKADTAPAPNPAVPGTTAVEQLAAVPAAAPQVLQNLTGLPATAPAPQPPTATASVNLPQPAPAVPQPAATNPLPGLTATNPVAPATSPVTGANQLVPNAQFNIPNVPGLPVPLPQQVSLPGDFTSLLPGGLPAATTPGTVPGVAPVTSPAATSPSTGLVPDMASLFPVSALP